jgi:hypothetical protein
MKNIMTKYSENVVYRGALKEMPGSKNPAIIISFAKIFMSWF